MYVLIVRGHELHYVCKIIGSCYFKHPIAFLFCSPAGLLFWKCHLLLHSLKSFLCKSFHNFEVIRVLYKSQATQPVSPRTSTHNAMSSSDVVWFSSSNLLGSQPSLCCYPSIQFLMLWWPRPPSIELSLLLLHHCNFASVINRNINIQVFSGWLLWKYCSILKGLMTYKLRTLALDASK